MGGVEDDAAEIMSDDSDFDEHDGGHSSSTPSIGEDKGLGGLGKFPDPLKYIIGFYANCKVDDTSPMAVLTTGQSQVS